MNGEMCTHPVALERIEDLHWVNTLDHHAVTKSTFTMHDGWRLVLDKVDDIHPDYFNQIQIWKR
jgi:hypothetical protein